MRGLSSPTALALRGERASLAGWVFGTGFFALIIGLISNTVSSAGLSENVQRQLRKLGDVSITKPSGYIGLCFLFFVLVVCLFGCAQMAAARHEEADERLETLFALPVQRARWLSGRIVLAFGGAVALSLAAGLLAWAGAAIEHAGVTLPSMLEAAGNCLPAAILFLGLAALAFAGIPRATTGIAYGLVAGAFVWQLFGPLLNVPQWMRELTPFQHVGLVPAQPFQLGAALVMSAIGLVAAAGAVQLFARRDLIGR